MTSNVILLQQSRILSFHQHKTWVPPNKRDEVCSAFVDVVDRENKRTVGVQTSGAAESRKEQDDYGYTDSCLAVMDPILWHHQLTAKP